MPSRKRLGRDPDCEAARLLECPVVIRPVADLVARPGDLVAARFIGLVGHRSSGERGSGPIRPTAALPKPRVAILHQRRPMTLSEDRRRVCSTHKGNLLDRVPPKNAPGATISQTHTPFGRCD